MALAEAGLLAPLRVLAPVFLLDLVAPAGDALDLHVGDGRPDLVVVDGQEFVDGQTPGERIGKQPDLVAGPDLGVQEMEGRVAGFAGAALVVVGEVEEEEEFPRHRGGRSLVGRGGQDPERDRADALLQLTAAGATERVASTRALSRVSILCDSKLRGSNSVVEC